jgi:outer membrane murein-binding lipoprotein Lpp
MKKVILLISFIIISLLMFGCTNPQGNSDQQLNKLNEDISTLQIKVLENCLDNSSFEKSSCLDICVLYYNTSKGNTPIGEAQASLAECESACYMRAGIMEDVCRNNDKTYRSS